MGVREVKGELLLVLDLASLRLQSWPDMRHQIWELIEMLQSRTSQKSFKFK